MARLIDAMQTVTKMSGRITPLIRMGANPTQVYNEVLQVLAEAVFTRMYLMMKISSAGK